MNNYKLPPALLSQNDRIQWVDAAKALGIFLVFWGHILYGGSSVGGIINKTIYSFHMPMYFILSGYVIKPDSSSLTDYIKKKFKRILLPAIILYVSTLPLYFYFLDYTTATIKSLLFRIFYITGSCAYNDPIWFFICMFQVLLIAKQMKMPDAGIKKLVILIIVFLSLSFLAYYTKWKPFCLFGINKCFLAVFFMGIGMLLRKLKVEKYLKILGVVLLPIWIISGTFLNSKVSMYDMNLGNLGLFIISGISGSIVFFSLSNFFNNNMIIKQYAQWIIFIICSHYVLVTLFEWVSARLSIDNTYVFDVTSALFVVVSLIIYKYFCVLIEKYIPVLMGKCICNR